MNAIVVWSCARCYNTSIDKKKYIHTRTRTPIYIVYTQQPQAYKRVALPPPRPAAATSALRVMFIPSGKSIPLTYTFYCEHSHQTDVTRKPKKLTNN